MAATKFGTFLEEVLPPIDKKPYEKYAICILLDSSLREYVTAELVDKMYSRRAFMVFTNEKDYLRTSGMQVGDIYCINVDFKEDAVAYLQCRLRYPRNVQYLGGIHFYNFYLGGYVNGGSIN